MARKQRQQPMRVLTAAATRINIAKNAEVRRQRSVRQDWQLDAFTYRNTIGELRYAVNFLANCAARMRMFVAALPTDGPSDMPIELSKMDNVPEPILIACQNAMTDLGNGRVAMANHMQSLSTNISLPGEAFLLGQTDEFTMQQTWSIRSIAELPVFNNQIMLREGPTDSTGMLGLVKLDPDLTTVSRMWQPDPEFRLLADSPMRAIMNECESLLILRRMIRATGRSRLAGAGAFLVPNEVSITINRNDNFDPTSDPFMDDLADAMMTPITNEGDASSVVPFVMRGPMEALKEVRHLDFARSFDAEARANREELVNVIATGLDLPKEVISGVADLNHWSAWQVDDNTFRHHVEPHVQTLSDCFTSGFLRPYIATAGIPEPMLQEWLPRLMFWYDPTELVTHPDRMQNATTLHEALVISDEAFREVGGFTDDDAPDAAEIEIRMIRTMRNWPANVVMALLHELDPMLSVPAMTGPPALPGIKAGILGGVDVPVAPTTPASSDDTNSTTTMTPPTSTTPDTPSTMTPPTSPDDASITAASILNSLTASGRRHLLIALRKQVAQKPPTPSAKSIELSRKLTMIDRDLRSRLTVLANNEMLHQLAKSGSKVRAKVAKNSELREKIAMTRNEHVMAVLGKNIIESKELSLTASSLMHNDWSSFKEQYMSMVQQAQHNATKVALQLAGIDEEEAASMATTTFGNSAEQGWSVLEDSMNSLAVNLAYAADPNTSVDDAIAQLNPETMVPTGTIRASLAVAGGATPQDLGTIITKSGASVACVPLGQAVGGVATGASLSNLLTNNGATQYSYTWEHGPSVNVFEPHENLDGYTFTSFTDPGLANNTDFPNNAYYLPGDHIGCLCDVTPMWVSAQDVQNAISNANVDEDFEPSDEDIAEAAAAVQAIQAKNALAQVDAEMPQAISNAKEAAKTQTAFEWAQSQVDYDQLEKQTGISREVLDMVAQENGSATFVNYIAKTGYNPIDAANEFKDELNSNATLAAKARNLLSSTDPFSTQSMLNKQSQDGFKNVQSYKMITQRQQDQLDTWTGTGYERMNRALRFNEYPLGAGDATKQAIDAGNKRLATAIRSQPRTTQSMIVQRIGVLPSDLKVGSTFTDRGFVATKMYGAQTDVGDGSRMIITLPKGTQGLDVNKSYDAYGRRHILSNEKEFLLPPNSTFRVDAINSDGTYVLTHIPTKVRTPKT